MNDEMVWNVHNDTTKEIENPTFKKENSGNRFSVIYMVMLFLLLVLDRGLKRDKQGKEMRLITRFFVV